MVKHAGLAPVDNSSGNRSGEAKIPVGGAFAVTSRPAAGLKRNAVGT
jgi:hypothetical protein